MQVEQITQAIQKSSRAAFLAEVFQSFPKFCGLLEIIPKSGGKRRLVLNNIQRAYCQARSQRDVVLKARQIGFTTLEQARDVWHFLTVPGARVVATCQSMTDGTPKKLLSANYRVFFQSLRQMGVQLNFRTETGSEWGLADRDATLRIVEAGASEAAAAKKGRAGTITRLHLTETAFYEYAEETLNALLECVPGTEHGTEVVSESTPNGASGVFYEQWNAAVQGRNGYKAHFYPWFEQAEYRTELEPGEVIRPVTVREQLLTAEQIKWYRQKVAEKGQDRTDQEYPTDSATCFLVSGRTFFERGVSVAMLAAAVPASQVTGGGTVRVWDTPIYGRDYVLALDPAEGSGGDNSAGIIYDRTNNNHVATIHGQLTPWQLARTAAELGKIYNGALVVCERNNHGHAVIQALEHADTKYPNIYRAADMKYGWLTSEVTRAAALDALEDAHRQGRWKTRDRELIAELLTFVVSKDGKAEATRGAHDDLVMAAVIGYDVLRKPGVARGVGTSPLFSF